MSEIWKKIDGHPNYRISNLGRVKSFCYNRERIIRQVLNNKGYFYVGLYYKGSEVHRKHYIHRLIAAAFIPNPENKIEVNHKNGVRTDNRIKNLEWVTHSENIAHAYRELGIINPMKGKFGSKNHNSKSVIQLTIDGNKVAEYGSGREAQRVTGIFSTTISCACNGKIKTAGGYKWKFKRK